MTPTTKIILIVVAVVVLVGCGITTWLLWPTSDNDDDSTVSIPATTKSQMKIKFVPDSSRTSAREDGDQFGGDVNRETLDIKSLQYYLSSIRFAEDLTLNGSAWSNPSNTLEVYSNELDVSTYENYGFDEADDDTTNYVDLMDTEALDLKLKQSIEIEETASYNYMMISWARPFKIEAIAYDENGDAVMATKAATSSEEITDSGGGGDYTYYRTTVPDMTNEPTKSAPTTVVFNNGGAFLRFAEVLTVSPEDGPYRLYLVYDPYQSIRASNVGGVGKLAQVVDENDAWFSASLMNMAAVICKPNDIIKRSRIRIVRPSSDNVNDQYDFLLQVYSLERTPTVISAVNVGILAKKSDTFVPAGAPQTATSLNEIRKTTDDKYSFHVWNDDAFISNLDLSTDGGTVSVYELAGSPVADNVTTDLTWEYIGAKMATFVTVE